MINLRSSNLTLQEVHKLFKFVEQVSDANFRDLLNLHPLNKSETHELEQIRSNFRKAWQASEISDGQIKDLALFPLLRLAGFYRVSSQIEVAENIAEIHLQDGDKLISGKLNMIAVNKKGLPDDHPFWILAIENQESAIEVRQGLPQLLTYAHQSLVEQPSVWGLITNGLQYLFVCLKQAERPSYQLLPILDLMYFDYARQLLQVLKAICKNNR